MKQTNRNEHPFKGTFGTLENLVDRISEVLQCSATIEDANHRLLAYSKHSEDSDPARIQTIIGRRVPEKVINSLWKHNILPVLNNSDDPLRIDQIPEVGLTDRVAIAIRKNKEILGYIWALEVEQKFTEEDLVLFKQAAQAAKSHLLQLQGRQNKNEEGMSEFFWQLLTGNIHSANEIEERFVGFHKTPPSQFSIIVIRFQKEISTYMKQQVQYLLSIPQSLTCHFHVVDQNEVVILVSPNLINLMEKEIKGFIDDFIVNMKKRFELDDCIGGSGTIYDEYDKIPQSYQEALKVVKYKEKFPELEPIFCYQDLGIYRYLDVLLETNRLDQYQNRSLQKLKEYDSLHHTELLETLESYLNHDSNINEAAKSLHIHMNTLSYRLKRIAEIGGIDLRNASQKVSLFIDLKLGKLQEKGHL